MQRQVEMVKRQVQVDVEEQLALVQRFGSIVDTVLGPRRIWSHRDRSPFHTGYKHKLQAGSDDRSIGLVLERSLVRQR
jgi:hypothetical protein